MFVVLWFKVHGPMARSFRQCQSRAQDFMATRSIITKVRLVAVQCRSRLNNVTSGKSRRGGDAKDRLSVTFVLWVCARFA